MEDRSVTVSNSVVDPADPKLLVGEIEAAAQRLAAARERLGRVIFGQRQVIDLSLITLLSGGHALLVSAGSSTCRM